MGASSDFRDTHRARKSVYKARNSSLRCGFEYKWVDTIQHDRSGWECVDVVCSRCVRDLEARRQPTYSEPAGFGHGIPVPAELTDLSFAEETFVSLRKVEGALRWLVRHSPAYRSVEIGEARLTQLPLDGQLDIDAVPRDTNGRAPDEDLGPAPGQRPLPRLNGASSAETKETALACVRQWRASLFERFGPRPPGPV